MQHHSVDNNPPLLDKHEKFEETDQLPMLREKEKLPKPATDQPCSNPFPDDSQHRILELQKAWVWLAAENSFLKTTCAQEKCSNRHLRKQVQALKEAIMILHAQRSEHSEKDGPRPQVEKFHTIVKRLESLEEDWKESIRKTENSTRELSQLRVEHAQVLETSYMLRDAYDKQIERLKLDIQENEIKYHDAENRYCCMSKLYQDLESSSRKEEEKHARFASQILQRHSEMEEQVSQWISGLESNISQLSDILNTSKTSISVALQSTNRLISIQRERCQKLEEGRRTKEAHVKKLLLLVKDLEGRAKSSLERLEEVEEERLSLQASLSHLKQASCEKDILIEQLDRQCAEYEGALTTARSCKELKKATSLKQLNSKPIKVKTEPQTRALTMRAPTEAVKGRDGLTDIGSHNASDQQEVPSRKPLMEKPVNRQQRDLKTPGESGKRSVKDTRLTPSYQHFEVKQNSTDDAATSDSTKSQSALARQLDPMLQRSKVISARPTAVRRRWIANSDSDHKTLHSR